MNGGSGAGPLGSGGAAPGHAPLESAVRLGADCARDGARIGAREDAAAVACSAAAGCTEAPSTAEAALPRPWAAACMHALGTTRSASEGGVADAIGGHQELIKSRIKRTAISRASEGHEQGIRRA